ncbi:peptidylprolyl isomerase [Sphingomonas colocasiae]|uniref:peptidylprolyl isomerase n=1 Tax=Sphingomonas colocasiae TaxID=1848973 RepID=A0ABS7PR34_9SPHN|nr:peptidylprolyl isomerase [Sphingomonas colocasiae]MBY8823805.1 peptidylprolyl isomerase [Sphingomonas colocasiae]
MLRRFVPLALLYLAVSPAAAQPPAAQVPPAVAADAAKPATVRVIFQTGEGAIVLELEKERAPITTANFLRYVDQKRFDGISFYRAMKLGDGFGLIQAGIRADMKKLLPPIKHEPTTQTGLSHVDGAISMARDAPGTARADFFISVGNLSSLDADPSKPGDNQGFAVFGRVVEGMDVVRRIMDAPTSEAAGEGLMKGQMIAAPVKVVAARRQP